MFASTSALLPRCAVCGADKAGHHYSGIVCSCCRVFFLRQTKRTKKPICRSRGKCTITPGVTDNCQACRYRKCLEANMKPEEVGRQRYVKRTEARPSITPETPPVLEPEGQEVVEIGISQEDTNLPIENTPELGQSLEISAFQPVKSQPADSLGCRSITNNFSAGFMFLNPLSTVQTATDYINCLMTLQNYVDNTSGLDPIDVYANVDVTLSDVLLNSQICSSRAAVVTKLKPRIRGSFQAAWDNFTPEVGASSYSLKHTYLRSITHFADYATSAPEIFALEESDKMKLIQHNCMDLNFLGAIYEYWQAKCDGTDLKVRGNRFHLSPEEQAKIDSLQKRIGPYFQYFCEILGRLGVVKGELVILKYIVLFTPPTGVSESGLQIINQARDKYCTILSSYIAENNPFISVATHTERVGELIGMVRVIKEASIFIQQLYTGFVTMNTGNLAGQLTYDLHLKDY